MTKDLSRRDLLRDLLAATTVIGFDPARRSWVTAQDLASGTQVLAAGFPPFAGELRTDDQALTAASDDFGHIVHHRPQAVLLPASVEDIVTLVQTDLAPFLADLAFLVDDGRFDTVQGSAAPSEAGGWHFLLETTKSFTPGGTPIERSSSR